MIRISYDRDIDALYIRLLEGERQCRCVCITDEVSLNLADDESVVGIEILDAKRIVGNGELPGVVLENVSLLEIIKGGKNAALGTQSTDMKTIIDKVDSYRESVGLQDHDSAELIREERER